MAKAGRLSKVYSCFTEGSVAVMSEIEVSVMPGIPTFSVIGLCDSSIREARGRVLTAIRASGFTCPKGHITISISPAYMRKSGSGFDLAMAMGILFASGQIPEPTGKAYFEGELGLDGKLYGTPNAVTRLGLSARSDFDYRIIPYQEEAGAKCTQLSCMTAKSLRDAASLFGSGTYFPTCYTIDEKLDEMPEEEYPDISCLKGQEKCKRAILIAAAGFHNLLLLGSPGSGKTLAGRIIAGLLPPLEDEEIPICFAVRDTSSDIRGLKYSRVRPYRTIGPQISLTGLMGSATGLKPGELQLANRGVLFADEICEYKSEIVQAMRKPLEDREAVLFKNGISFKYPADFIFVGAGNPCRCGLFYEKGGRCRCTATSRRNYLANISGPFLERIDLFSEMRSISRSDMEMIYTGAGLKAQSPEWRERIREVWQMQKSRYKEFGGGFNATVRSEDLPDLMRIPFDVVSYATELAGSGLFSARAFTKILRCARTIADLDQRADVAVDDISEACMFRPKEI
ncbi:MAG: ATP-binding protein [Saccharofermentans sp.]|nr:ATP-binding protein [Saccharofermentans sp.]